MPKEQEDTTTGGVVGMVFAGLVAVGASIQAVYYHKYETCALALLGAAGLFFVSHLLEMWARA